MRFTQSWNANFLAFFLFVSLGGCTWLNMFDTNPEPSPNSYKFKAGKRSLAYRYLGKSKEDVLKDWGRPEYIEENASYCKKMSGDCGCIKNKCGADVAFAEVWWRYEAKERVGRTEWIYYSVDFYFNNNVVIKVQ